MQVNIATSLMDDIVQQYNLNVRKRQLVVATAKSVQFFSYPQLDKSIFNLQIADNNDKNAIYALTVIPGMTEKRIAFTTRHGKLYVVDSQGNLIRQTKVSDESLLHVTYAQIEGHTYILACCTDRTIRVFTPSGRQLATIETPDKVLSIDIYKYDGRVKMGGGMQNHSAVCLWDVHDIITKQDATPQAILSGGEKPAFSTKFITIMGETWFVHGCWDSRLYFYRQPFKNTDKILSPARYLRKNYSCYLRGRDQIYHIHEVMISGVPYILAGTEKGYILAWRLVPLRNNNPPSHVIDRLNTRVRCMTIAKIDGQQILFA
ncbi:MAG: hypothetical protein B6242_16555 [Anaerolineaceae bacterium 4572_78]|nr:MAG: hypothetical protein B6242_16555 [Anaerolineaceae bacterium 4572_78]